MIPKDIYENCRSWLHFAETKNGFALAFCGAFLAAETSLLSGVDSAFKPFVLVSMMLVAVAASCSLISFVPRNQVDGVWVGSATVAEGIVYFGDIAAQDRDAYVTRAAQKLGVNPEDAISAELLSQSYNLSVITVKKLRLFYASVIIAGVAIVAPLVVAAAWWLSSCSAT